MSRLIVRVVEDVASPQPHEQAVACFQRMGAGFGCQFQPTGEEPEVLGNPSVRRLPLEDDARTRGELDLDDIDRRAEAIRRDGAAQIAGFRIAPEALVCTPCKRRCFLSLEGEER
ncbi:hypothetical protein D9M70_478270 [compost metagenome]